MKYKAFVGCLLAFVFSTTLFSQPQTKAHPVIEKKVFGTLNDGRKVYCTTLTNSSGMQARIIDFGAIVVSLSAPDRKGNLADVVLAYDSLDAYVNGKSYFGAIVGRYGNRIGKGKFALDGKEYQLTINNGKNHLHGGTIGFDKVLWTSASIESSTDPAVSLTYLSKDGEQGYPGTVTLKVTYTLTQKNELRVDYEGTTDRTTILNPTHHSYFNLTGDPTKTILDHELMIDANRITPVDAGLIPTGTYAEVQSTPFDFRRSAKIGSRIDAKDEQLRFGKGYDHNWVLNGYDKKVRKCAEVYDSSSGRVLDVFTDQPGLQFYSGNFLNGNDKGKNGVMYQFRTGLCLEAQCFPDSPNKPQWPTSTLKPGEKYQQTTIYKFSTK